jgi:hypothetical protein
MHIPEYSLLSDHPRLGWMVLLQKRKEKSNVYYILLLIMTALVSDGLKVLCENPIL